MRVSVFIFTVLAAGASATDAAEIRVVATETLYPAADTRHATHALALQLYTFLGSRWSPTTITEAVRRAMPLLGQCGIAPGQSRLHVLDAPARFRAYSTATARQLLREVQVMKPALFFVDDTLSRPAYDAETIGLANARNRPELAHTIWVAYGARDLPFVLAHELVHLLSNSGEHSREPGNLMQEETAPRNDRLTEAQCAALRDRGIAQRLLEAL